MVGVDVGEGEVDGVGVPVVKDITRSKQTNKQTKPDQTNANQTRPVET